MDGDIEKLAATMREADKREIAAVSGRSPVEVLQEGLDISTEVWTATLNDRVLCMFGVVGERTEFIGARVGVAWLLTSELVDKAPKLFWKACQVELKNLLERWDVLYNAIDARHEKALRWATRLGFQFEPPQQGGVLGLSFVPFVVSREIFDV